MRKDEDKGARDQNSIAVDTENGGEAAASDDRIRDSSRKHQCPSCLSSETLKAVGSEGLLLQQSSMCGERLRPNPRNNAEVPQC